MLRKSSKQAPSTPGIPPGVVPASLTDPSLPLPRLIVFDLDYTLWPFWVDTHATPPLKPNAAHSSATDRYGETFAFYDDVPSVLQLLPLLPASGDSSVPNGGGGGGSSGVRLAVASRTCAPALARELLKMLHLPSLGSGGGGGSDKPRRAVDAFDGGMEIYPSSKIRHFEALQKRTGLRFEDMLFFDDEARNRDTETLGVTMYLVRDGVTWDEVDKGVAEWRRRRGYRPS